MGGLIPQNAPGRDQPLPTIPTYNGPVKGMADAMIKAAKAQGPSTNFLGDLASGFGSVYSPSVQPGGGGVGTFLGQTGGLVAPAILGGMVGGPLGAATGAFGAGGALEANNELRAKQNLDPLKIGVQGGINALGAVLPEIKGANVFTRALKNAPINFGFGTAANTATQALEGQPIDPLKALKESTNPATAATIIQAMLGRRGEAPTEIPKELEKAIPELKQLPPGQRIAGLLPPALDETAYGAPIRQGSPLTALPKPPLMLPSGEPFGLLPGGTETSLAGNSGILLRNHNLPPAPEVGPNLLPPGQSPAGLLSTSKVAGLLPEFPRRELPSGSPDVIPLEGHGTTMVRETTHGGLQRPGPAGVVEKPTGGVMIEGLGRTEGQPTRPAKVDETSATPSAPTPGNEAAPFVPQPAKTPLEAPLPSYSAEVQANRLNSTLTRLKRDQGFNDSEIQITQTGPNRMSVQADLSQYPEPVRPSIQQAIQDYQTTVKDPSVSQAKAYKTLEAQKASILDEFNKPTKTGVEPKPVSEESVKFSDNKTGQAPQDLSEAPQKTEPLPTPTPDQLRASGQQSPASGEVPEAGPPIPETQTEPRSNLGSGQPVQPEELQHGASGGRGYTISDALPSTDKTGLFSGYRPEVVNPLETAIKANRSLSPESGVKVEFPYSAEAYGHTGTLGTKRVTPLSFAEGPQGLVLHALNDKGQRTNYYINAKDQNGSFIRSAPKIVEGDHPDFIQRSNEGRPSGTKESEVQSARQQVKALKDLNPDIPELKRLHKLIGPKMGTENMPLVKASLERMAKSGKLDQFLKDIEPVVGKC